MDEKKMRKCQLFIFVYNVYVCLQITHFLTLVLLNHFLKHLRFGRLEAP